MKPGQKLTLWWQQYFGGRLRTPQSLVAASRRENQTPVEDRFTRGPDPSPHWDAPKRLAAPNFFGSEPHMRQQQRADWQYCDPRMRELAALVIQAAEKHAVPLYIHSAFRTEAEQDELVARGVTKAPFPRSAHNIGEAWDLVHGVYHWELRQEEWTFIHHLVQVQLRKLNSRLAKQYQLSINWGGNDGTPEDKFRWDPAHYEISDYRNRTRIVHAGPPERMTPAVILARHRAPTVG